MPNQLTHEKGWAYYRWLDEIWSLPASGHRVEAMRETGRSARQSLRRDGYVAAIRSCNLCDSLHPRAMGFWHLDTLPIPYIQVRHQMWVVQFFQEGQLKTLLYNPMSALARQLPNFLQWLLKKPVHSPRIVTHRYATPLEHLRELGLKPEQVDYLAFDHLHGPDLRYLLGTNDDFDGPRQEPLFPNARLLAQKAEMDALKCPHPLHFLNIETLPIHGVRKDRIEVIDGSCRIGEGISLLWTPGRTAGHQTLALNTKSALCLISGNGVAPDSYAPAFSKIPGMATLAVDKRQAVVLNVNPSECPRDQFASMVLELMCADKAPNDSNFPYILSTLAFRPSLLSLGLRPHVPARLSVGDLVRVRQSELSGGLLDNSRLQWAGA